MRFDPIADRPLIRPPGDRDIPRGSWLRVLSQVLTLAGPCAEFERHLEKPWASATFSGSRHTIALTFSGPEAVAAGEAFIAALPEHEFHLSGHLVADASVVECEQVALPQPRLTIIAELLVLIDDF